MQRSSTREDQSRAQSDPLVALVALFAVSLGVSLYAGVLDDVAATAGVERDVATPTLERVYDTTSTAGIVDPSGLTRSLAVGPDGYDLNVTLRAAGRTWHAGPPVPAADTTPDSATRPVSVRHEPGQIRPGSLRVVVWS